MKQKSAVHELMFDIITEEKDQDDMDDYCQGQKT